MNLEQLNSNAVDWAYRSLQTGSAICVIPYTLSTEIVNNLIEELGDISQTKAGIYFMKTFELPSFDEDDPTPQMLLHLKHLNGLQYLIYAKD